jgi:hypothetical protein
LGKSRKEIRDQIFAKEVNVKVSDVPPGWSVEAADFINKLLRRKSKDRLGKGGVIELKDHSWLRGIQWSDIYKKEVITPFLPKEGDNFDSNYCNRQDQIDKQAYDYYLHKINNETFFLKFYFNFYDIKNQELFFELDNVNYKFINLHDDSIKESNANKVESTNNCRGKSLTIAASNSTILTPRLELHTSSLSQVYFNQTSLTHRKLFGNNQNHI